MLKVLFVYHFFIAGVHVVGLDLFLSQPAFTCPKSTMKTPEQCVKSVQSLQ